MKVKVLPSISSRSKPGLTLVIVIMVITSPVLMLVNPAQVSAANISNNNSNRIDSSGYHSTPSIPQATASPLSSPTPMVPAATNQRNGDFTAQAPLLGPATFRSTDLVSSTAIYEIQFITTTTGVIDKIDITFPPGTGVALAGIIERVGITGPGVITKSGSTVTLDLNTPVSVPAGTFVRLEMVDISNPPNPANYKISVTTKNSSNMPIDGPSLSPAYTIRQVSTGMIANNAVTTPKIADGAVTTGDIANDAIVPDVMIEVGDPVLVPAQTAVGGIAICPASHPSVMGGGFEASALSDEFMHASNSQPSNAEDRWGVVMFNSHPTDTFSFSAKAMCIGPMP